MIPYLSVLKQLGIGRRPQSPAKGLPTIRGTLEEAIQRVKHIVLAGDPYRIMNPCLNAPFFLKRKSGLG